MSRRMMYAPAKVLVFVSQLLASALKIKKRITLGKNLQKTTAFGRRRL
jgi:hypothetical protein